jgi:CheY-like chemotaxis protein
MTPQLLITDDDRDFRETLSEVFRRRGFATTLASDGEEAYAIATQQPVHVALLDMHMPRMTGLETIRRWRQSNQLVPCILLSAAFDDQTIAAAQSMTTVAVLNKPIRIATIYGMVKQFLREAYGFERMD